MNENLIPILLKNSIITEIDAEEVSKCEPSVDVLEVLFNSGKISYDDIADCYSEYYKINRLSNLNSYSIPIEVDNDSLKAYRFFPYRFDEDKNNLHIAIDDPTNIAVIDFLKHRYRVNVIISIVSSKELDKKIRETIEGSIAVVNDQEEQVEEVDLIDSPAVNFVREIIQQAVSENASDIHIEPFINKVIVRFRINSDLKKVTEYSRKSHDTIVSRIKIQAGLDTTERKLPQDGKIWLSGLAGVDLRVSTLPTLYGEKVVIRVLNKMKSLPTIEELFHESSSLNIIKDTLRVSYGLTLISGPTGSGKTTTAFAILKHLCSSIKNVVTIEDPPEYEIEGVNHVALNTKAGFTFNVALRSVVRQNVDIILVGEIRDKETAEIAIESSLANHLVISTIHTNNSSSTPIRLIDMGIEPYLIASSLNCIISQRLVKKICNRCARKYRLDKESKEYELLEIENAVRGEGCSTCGFTGTGGMMAITEVMPITPVIRDLIKSKATFEVINKQSIKEGMIPINIMAKELVLKGVIEPSEYVRVMYSGWINQ